MFGFNKKKAEKVISNVSKNIGLLKKGDAPSGASGINVKVALKKTDSPFKKDDYKNPFMKED
jgi:hypothetical protein